MHTFGLYPAVLEDEAKYAFLNALISIDEFPEYGGGCLFSFNDVFLAPISSLKFLSVFANEVNLRLLRVLFFAEIDTLWDAFPKFEPIDVFVLSPLFLCFSKDPRLPP